MKKQEKEIFNLFLRYLILLIIPLYNLYLIYLIFTPLTLYLSYLLINLFYGATLNGDLISFNDVTIQIIGACVAGSAYYLLLILNLSTPDIKLAKRIKMIIYSLLLFLVFNVLRILILSSFLNSYPDLFDVTHYIFWFFLSIVFVVGIWFFQVKHYKIKKIPVYSDVKTLTKYL